MVTFDPRTDLNRAWTKLTFSELENTGYIIFDGLGNTVNILTNDVYENELVGGVQVAKLYKTSTSAEINVSINSFIKYEIITYGYNKKEACKEFKWVKFKISYNLRNTDDFFTGNINL